MLSKKLLIILSVIAVSFAVSACGNNDKVIKGVPETSEVTSDEDLVLTMEVKDISDVERGKTYPRKEKQ